ncbi:MAG: hypothetical protein ACXV8Q_00555 [Methylobacter sp.]
MPGFSAAFAVADSVIMAALGDDITLMSPTGAESTVKCVLATRAGGKTRGHIEWLDNIIAQVDINSVIVELLANDMPGLGKNWSALYLGKAYVVSEVLPKGDGVLVVILNQSGNTTATANGWK